MSTKVTIGALAVIIILAFGFFYLSASPRSDSALTEADAITAAIAVHPELAKYQTTSLPPSSIEAEAADDGWNLGFIQRGSGLPGILNAQCFHVNNKKEVTETGQYQRQKDVVTENLILSTCEPKDVPPSSTATLPYGNVTLKLNEIAKFEDISILPISIEEDSRCPSDVQCIQAGTVRVKIQVISGMGTSTSIVKLGSAFTTEGESITLTSVTPDKNSKAQLTPGNYHFTFTVVKQGTPTANNPKGKCYVGGCSSQLCTDAPDAMSTCEYTAKYACYKTATCERQTNGKCGWTETPQLTACLSNS